MGSLWTAAKAKAKGLVARLRRVWRLNFAGLGKWVLNFECLQSDGHQDATSSQVLGGVSR